MSELNDWFLSLPEARQAVLRDDKWFLAEAAFAAGKASRAQPAQAGQYTCPNGDKCKHGSWCSEVYCQELCQFRKTAQAGQVLTEKSDD